MRTAGTILLTILLICFAKIANSQSLLSDPISTFAPSKVNANSFFLTKTKQTLIGIQSQWMLTGTDIRFTQASLTHASERNAFQVQASYNGTPDYSTQSISGQGNVALSQEFTLGAAISLQKTTEQPSNKVQGSIFCSYAINSQWQFWGFTEIASQKRTGLAWIWRPSRQLQTSFSLLNTPIETTADITLWYQLKQSYATAFSMGTGPWLAGGSIFKTNNHWRYGLSVYYHRNQLGFSPMFQLYYSFHELKEENRTVPKPDVHAPLGPN